MTIQVLDVYHSNRVDFPFEKATGTDGVLIKGGQGQYLEYFHRKCTFIDQARDVGLPWGVFWQMDARYSPESHKAALKQGWPDGNFGPLGLWLACELPFYPCPDWLYNRMQFRGCKPVMSVWDGIAEWSGEAPGIYTSISKWNLIFGRAPDQVQLRLAFMAPLWVAQYKVKAPQHFGLWDHWDLWQYTENPDYSIAREEWWTERMQSWERTAKSPVTGGASSPQSNASSSPSQSQPSHRPISRRLRRPER